jgi:putative alpha-1,2-mannosidase
MSAFVVFSMMGFYPVTPGIPTYDLGSPIFDKTTIHLKNGKDLVIVAHNNSHDNKYVESIRLNGQALNQVWFRHADIANGGTLELTMGDTPNTALGSAASSFPPASMTIKPEDLGQPAVAVSSLPGAHIGGHYWSLKRSEAK